MSYLALARKWRPKMFQDVIGQEHVVSALSNALGNQRVHHAFLFSGTRGVGKTTLARIFAKALNCETGINAEPCGECSVCQSVDSGNFVDLIEVDAASRTRVDDTRELLDNVQYTPTHGRFKIYLIDEVHMLSTHSFNALLKTLEEPPEHVKFLLATTNPQKLPTTVLSRCIQFNLKSVDIGKISAQLEKILKAEEVDYESQGLITIARSANGSVRDALSLLDQAIAYTNGNVTSEQVRAMLGMIDNQYIIQLLEQVLSRDGASLLMTVAEMSEQSIDFRSALDELISTLHNISLFKVSPQSVEWKGVDTTILGRVSENIDGELLQLFYQICLMGKKDFELALDSRSGFEMIMLRMLAFQPSSGNAVRTQSSQPRSETSPVQQSQSPVKEPQAPEKNKPIPIQPSADLKSVDDGVRENGGAVLAEGGQQPVTEPKIRIDSRLKDNLQSLLDSANWHDFINNSGLNGISREILMNSIPLSAENQRLKLVLNETSRHLYKSERLQKIESHCREYLDLDLQLDMEIRDLTKGAEKIETPTQSMTREKQEIEEAARQQFTHDPNVRELAEMFDAEIVSDSIKPA